VTYTVKQLIQIARDLDIEIPEGESKLERCYAIQCGYPEGWSWLLRDSKGIEWLASQYGARDLMEFHRDERVFFVGSDGMTLVLSVGLPSLRKQSLTHYGQSRPFSGCQKGVLEDDKVTMNKDAVTCRDCLKSVRKSLKSQKREEERQRCHKEWEASLTPEQRRVRRRAWGFPGED
jgi:hypothetical protein